MNATSVSQGTRITPPSDFPVVWQNPEDEQLHWTRDREHIPDPITPMYSSMIGLLAKEGRRRTLSVYEEAIIDRYDRRINTYDYTCLVPFTGTPEEVSARAQRNREQVGAVSLRLGELWEQQWKPEIEAHFTFWDSFDLEGADMPALVAHLEETFVRAGRLWELHYLFGPPMWFAIDEFETFYCDLFPGKSKLDAHRLLQGFDNKTLELGRALWWLSRLAKASPAVRRILLDTPAAEVCAVLKGFYDGINFLTELRAFLIAYGGRSNLWDWGYPSWQDDPTPVIANIKNYIAQPDRDLQAELAQAAAEREAAIEEARHELDGYPQPVRERFEQLLKAAQDALVLTENHTFYTDFNGFGRVHQVIHEFGQRFSEQGRLNHPDDVFYLWYDELREMIADTTVNHREMAAVRHAEAEHWAKYSEPSELGTRPAEPIYLYSPNARRMLRYTGGLTADEPVPQPEPGLLRGQGGSPGKVRGTARLIRSLDEAHRLQPGDILVTTTTAPPWTPLFLTAAGVVTDAGGLLSHGAVVAREYHIPAVVGTRCATARITDGQLIEVDGSNGVVYLL